MRSGGSWGPGAAGNVQAGARPTPPASGLAFQIYYYADEIYRSSGVNDSDIQYVTAGTGSVNVVMTMCAVSAPGAEAHQLSVSRGHLQTGGPS